MTWAKAGPSSYGYRKSAELYNGALAPLRAGGFNAARTGIIRFIDDPIMARIVTRLLCHAEPPVVAARARAKADFDMLRPRLRIRRPFAGRPVVFRAGIQ